MKCYIYQYHWCGKNAQILSHYSVNKSEKKNREMGLTVSHTLQWYSVLVWCTLQCRCKWSLVVNVLSQSGHSTFFFLWTLRMWWPTLLWLANTLADKCQTYKRKILYIAVCLKMQFTQEIRFFFTVYNFIIFKLSHLHYILKNFLKAVFESV